METINLIIVLSSLSMRNEAQIYSTWLRALQETKARHLLALSITYMQELLQEYSDAFPNLDPILKLD